MKSCIRSHTKSIPYPKAIGNYLLGETIGEGTFGKVKLCTHIPTNARYAVKILPREQINTSKKVLICREISILSKLKHPNIIGFKEILKTPKHFYLVMEYCPCGELFSLVSKKKQIPEEEASFYFYQLINGLEFLHSKGIVHRDIKLENVLLLSNGMIKIIDFGLSNYFTENMLLKSSCGSPSYAAPEMLLRKGYDGRSIDIWCSGIILFGMLCGFLPFRGHDDQSLFDKIINGKYSFPNNVSLMAKSLIKKLLTTDFEQRIKIDQIKKNNFYVKGKNIYDQKFPLNHKRCVSSIQSHCHSYCDFDNDIENNNRNDSKYKEKNNNIATYAKLQMKTQNNDERYTVKALKDKDIKIYDRKVTQNRIEPQFITETPNYLKWNKDAIHNFGLRLKSINNRKNEKREKLSISVRQGQTNAKTPIITNKEKTRSIMKQLLGKQEVSKSPHHNGCQTERLHRESPTKKMNNLNISTFRTIAKVSDFEKNQITRMIAQRAFKRNYKANHLVVSINCIKKENKDIPAFEK